MGREYQELANAIILQAVIDWRMLCKEKQHFKDGSFFEELTYFFKSEWCKTLSSIDPKIILTKLQAEKDEVFC